MLQEGCEKMRHWKRKMSSISVNCFPSTSNAIGVFWVLILEKMRHWKRKMSLISINCFP
jgi:hypothetical protein